MSIRALGFVIAHLSAFLLSFVFWVTVLMIVLTIGLFAGGRLDPASLQDPNAIYDMMGPGVLGGLTLLQNLGLVGISAALAALVPLRDDLVSIPAGWADLAARWRRAFAVGRAAAPLTIAGAVGALTVGLFPSWLAERLVDLMPEGWEGTLDMIPRLLADGSPGGRALLAFSIVIGAPIFEELVFRGYLWSVFERVTSPIVAFVATTLLFALFHADPVHTVSLLPTAVFLGWLRLASGSIWPAVAAHFVNNGLGALIMLTADTSVEGSMPLWLALPGLAFTVLVCAIGWRYARARAPAP